MLLLSTRAISCPSRSISRRCWIYWQLGVSKSPITNLWSANLLPLFPSGDVGIHVLWLLVSISIAAHILHFKECDSFFDKVSDFLEIKDCSSLKVLKTSAHTSDTCKWDLPCAPNLRDLLIYFQIFSGGLDWQWTTWEDSLLPLISAGCILPPLEPWLFSSVMHRQ